MCILHLIYLHTKNNNNVKARDKKEHAFLDNFLCIFFLPVSVDQQYMKFVFAHSMVDESGWLNNVSMIDSLKKCFAVLKRFSKDRSARVEKHTFPFFKISFNHIHRTD